MSWIPNALMSGIQSIFQRAAGSEISRQETALEDIRKAMLRELDYSSAIEASKLELKVVHASDLQDLWYLRGDIMAAVAAVDGEVLASQKLSLISSKFKGLLPRAQTSRPRRSVG
jgi:hypothetical protein